MLTLVRWFTLLLATLLLVGCKNSAPTIGGTPRPKVYEKIACLNPSATDVLISQYVLVSKLVGVSDAESIPGAEGKVVVVRNTKVDLEALKASEAELVIYDSTLFSDNDIKAIEDLGIDTFDIDADSLFDLENRLLELGNMIGMPMRVSEYFDDVYQETAAAEAQFQNLKRPTVVTLLGGAGEYMVLGKDALAADILRGSGADPVGPESDRYETVNVEWILQQDPDIVMVLGEDTAQVQNDARLKTLRAVQEGSLYSVDEKALTRIDNISRVVADLSKTFVKYANDQTN